MDNMTTTTTMATTTTGGSVSFSYMATPASVVAAVTVGHLINA
eukprot:CAMPEP_0181482164 /NCGR_PEP_ID=MMETSP1110-20121109/44693_1 /TAXON_ID=174948 /ORGANISM="Symbiodinium sp., Strain CCMP421" /LENGTH=42 /DNA_ID= /DNA_START= /DNA_END= /DNA_ORIENTATION=